MICRCFGAFPNRKPFQLDASRSPLQIRGKPVCWPAWRGVGRPPIRPQAANPPSDSKVRDRLCETCGIGPEVALVDRAVVADHEGHDSGGAILRRPGQHREAADHPAASTHMVPTAPPGAAGTLRFEGAVIGGFALLSWPAGYGASGIMTFIVGPRHGLREQPRAQYRKSFGAITNFESDGGLAACGRIGGLPTPRQAQPAHRLAPDLQRRARSIQLKRLSAWKGSETATLLAVRSCVACAGAIDTTRGATGHHWRQLCRHRSALRSCPCSCHGPTPPGALSK